MTWLLVAWLAPFVMATAWDWAEPWWNSDHSEKKKPVRHDA